MPGSATPRNSRATGPAGEQDPDGDEREGHARQRPPGRLRREVEVDLDLARQRRPQLADPAVEGSRRRSTRPRGPAAGCGDGWLLARRHLGGDLDRLAVALVALGGGVAFRGDALGLAGLLEQCSGARPARSPRRPAGRARSRARRGRAPAGRAPSRPGRRAAGRCSTACSATLSRPGFRSPRVLRSWSALSSFLRARLVPAVGAADRGLETVAQGALVARQVAELEVVDRRGRAEEALGRDAGQLGHHLVGEGRIGDRLALVLEQDRALRAGERLLERADLPAVLVVLLELDGDDRAGLRRRVPRAERLELAGRARRRAWSGPARAPAGRSSCRPRSGRG